MITKDLMGREMGNRYKKNLLKLVVNNILQPEFELIERMKRYAISDNEKRKLNLYFSD